MRARWATALAAGTFLAGGGAGHLVSSDPDPNDVVPGSWRVEVTAVGYRYLHPDGRWVDANGMVALRPVVTVYARPMKKNHSTAFPPPLGFEPDVMEEWTWRKFNCPHGSWVGDNLKMTHTYRQDGA